MLKGYLHYGKGDEPRQTVEVPVKETAAPINRSVSGYGKRIPTSYMVQVDGKWRRVYCCIYSNVGTLYIGDLSDSPSISIDRE